MNTNTNTNKQIQLCTNNRSASSSPALVSSLAKGARALERTTRFIYEHPQIVDHGGPQSTIHLEGQPAILFISAFLPMRVGQTIKNNKVVFLRFHSSNDVE